MAMVVAPQPDRKRKTRHWVGPPPGSGAGATGWEPSLLAWPRVIVIDGRDGWLLYRYAVDGSVVGDTWHSTLEEAKAQALFEYEELLGEWREVPDGTADPVAQALGLESSDFR